MSNLELDRNGQDIGGDSQGIIVMGRGINSPTEIAILANLIIHDGLETNRSVAAIIIATLPGDVTVMNTIIYDIRTNAADADNISGVLDISAVTDTIRLSNVTVFNVTNNNGSGYARGISIPDNATNFVRNSISMDTNGTSSGSIVDYEPATYSNATVSHNMASDATASGTGSLDSKTAGNQFVSTVDGSEDLHLKTGADAIDAGTDLVTFPSGVEIDIDGRNRDAEGDTWDMGADELVAGAPSATPIYQIIKNDERIEKNIILVNWLNFDENVGTDWYNWIYKNTALVIR